MGPLEDAIKGKITVDIPGFWYSEIRAYTDASICEIKSRRSVHVSRT